MPFRRKAQPEDYPERDNPPTRQKVLQALRRQRLQAWPSWEEWGGAQEQEDNLRKALGIGDRLGQSHRKIPESEIERARRKDISVTELARQLGVSRQAIYLRMDHYSVKTIRLRTRQWLVLFLYRIGLKRREIANALGLTTFGVQVILRRWGVDKTPEEFPVYVKVWKPQLPGPLRRWQIVFLHRLGFQEYEIADLTGYTSMTVNQHMRNMGLIPKKRKKKKAKKRRKGRKKRP